MIKFYWDAPLVQSYGFTTPSAYWFDEAGDLHCTHPKMESHLRREWRIGGVTRSEMETDLSAELTQ